MIPYNPLDKLNLGKSVAQALLEQNVRGMKAVGEIKGAGIYAIYYTGDFPAYAPVATKNRNDAFDQPIYVGKAIPKGGRKGGISTDMSRGTALRDRLRQHAASIDQAENLDVGDFHYRCLVVDDIWIPLGENMIIEQFRPIWNVVIDGFGNKDPGNRRAAQYRSSWDVLHPGRLFTKKLADGVVTPESVLDKLERYFAGLSVELIRETDEADGASQ
ncbi:MAG: Eco29kI family restriction endonuclease [Candidatus Competibacteraceae bacterium]|nr:Eco29kI family restriction endonuclease [Candidatus Competibacteraceae bacterium]MBK8896406.1 Eco29kI family restriction endonuclease [Candidatus Competibacteraceae bacterium]MBK8964161.1 Eco29kI family restriction endonuclease [Candidatus Competibacteraceae bacterium]MBK9952821.1 Eco29kI family restriction endonuclease [Candidatus Competibacteraceae bacterium]